MSKGNRGLATCVAGVLLAGALAAAGEPEKLFQELFGPEAKKVDATPSKLDDVEFATKLLKASRTLTEAPEFRLYLCEKVYDYGIRNPKGYPSAETALNLLGESAPDRQEQWDEKRLELYLLQYRGARGASKRPLGESYITQSIVVGDHKGAKGHWSEAAKFYQQAVNTATYLRSLQKAQAAEKLAQAEQMKQAEQLEERLKGEPQNAAARVALVKLYIELDHPAEAAKYVDPIVGEPWRTCVPLAAKPATDLPTQVCYELGNWYRTLAFSSRPPAKLTLAQRAKDYYLTYLDKLRADGARADQLEEARRKINAALKEVGQTPLPTSTAFEDPAVQKAMDKAIAYLWSQQVGLGCWQVYTGTSSSYSEGYYNTRPTAQVMLALLEGGAKFTDKRLAKALRYLEMHTTPRTEALALRALVWEHAYRQRKGVYLRRMGVDVLSLIRGTTTGGYYYRVDYSYSSTYNCYSWSPPLAVAAGDQQKLSVPRKYWEACLSYWIKQQKADGGWACRDYGSSTMRTGSASSIFWTTTGLATCALCLRQLYGPETVRRMSGPNFECLRKGLAWLDKELRTVASLRGETSYYYSSYRSRENTVYDALWHLSRLGLLTGRKRIGSIDWYRAGCDYLLSTQSADGSWGDATDTARAILFLINGRKLHESGLAVAGPATPVTPTVGAAETDPTRKAARDKIEVLKERLQTNPKSESIAQELLRLYVVELEEPASAAAYADKTGDKDAPKRVGLAAQDASSFSEEQCLDMAEWYIALAEGSSRPGRVRVLTNAAACYQRFLSLHTAGDAQRLKARLGLQKAQSMLAEMKD
jgi:hypothetical protein